jgi:excinuclease ABC subunit B
LSPASARGDRFQTLLGVTGSGKTMTMANVIAQWGRPALVLSHNKTLAAQLYGELKGFFPNNAVEYFISYYDYYQPEAYVPSSDTYIEKDASINEDIDRLRLRATSSLMERDDVIIVATVSAIYGLGDPETYRESMVQLRVGQQIPRDDILKALVASSTVATTWPLTAAPSACAATRWRSSRRTRSRRCASRCSGDEIEKISKIDPLTGQTITPLQRTAVYPAKHFVTTRPTLERAVEGNQGELSSA